MADISRMQFLRGDIKGKNKPFRPPWAIPEKYFADFCTRCDKCIEVCFDDLIVKGQGGFPQMDFNRGGCDFCEDCLNICEASALKKMPLVKNNHEDLSDSSPAIRVESDLENFFPPWLFKANIKLTNCLSMNGTICRSCGESCEIGAIKFNLKVGGIAEPQLNTEQCTGCGACFAVCPVKAIELKDNFPKNEIA